MNNWRQICIWSCLATGLASALPCAAAPAHPPLGGIYVVATAKRLLGPDQRIDQALQNPLIDGVYISLNWDMIEPAPGQFNWSVLDSELAVVAADHKKASLAIIPGEFAPAWVYQAGAAAFNTVVEPDRQQDFCSPVRFPVPWDPAYLKAWTGLVAAFGARYANNPLVTAIKITGIDYRTDETSLPWGTYLHLPADRMMTSPVTGVTCAIPDDVAAWQSDGYNAAKLDGAFTQIVASFKSAFPGLPMGIMTSDHSFPPLSPDGTARDPAGFALATTDFFQIGRQQLGGEFFGQSNGLKAQNINPGVASFGVSNPVGYQEAWPVDGDRHCVMNGGQTPCDEVTVFQETMNTALSSNAKFVEIFYNDANAPDLQPILRQTRQTLGAKNTP